MSGIYVSGFAGAGKTTLCADVAEEFKIEHKTEVIRTRLTTGKVTNQKQFLNAYLDIHRENTKKQFICDRAVGDVLVWNGWSLSKKTAKELHAPSLVIVPEPPPMEWIEQNGDIWFNDPVRMTTHIRKWNTIGNSSKSAMNKQFKKRFVRTLYYQSMFEFEQLVNFYTKMDWPLAVIPAQEDFLYWQDLAKDAIGKVIYPKDAKTTPAPSAA